MVRAGGHTGKSLEIKEGVPRAWTVGYGIDKFRPPDRVLYVYTARGLRAVCPFYNMLTIFEAIFTRSSRDFIEVFFASWPIIDILRVSMTCYRLHLAFKSYRHIVWNPERFFSRWFSSPIAFRRLLGQCNAIVSGSQALQFFDRTEYDDSDLDIFMRPAGVIRMSYWLMDAGYALSLKAEGYTFWQKVVDAIAEDCDGPTFLPNHMRAVYTFSRLVTSSIGVQYSKQVQLIVVDIDPVEFITFDFHSSMSRISQLSCSETNTCVCLAAVINFITFDRAVCGFPYSTLSMRVSYLCREQYEDPVRAAKWFSKYSSRGFHMITGRSERDYSRLSFGRRTLSDKNVWVVKFDGELRFDFCFYYILTIFRSRHW